jgi:hypothetical protein
MAASSPAQQRNSHHVVAAPPHAAGGWRAPSLSSSPAASRLLHDTTVLTAVNKGLTSMRSILHLEEMVSLTTLNLHMNLLTSLDRGLMASACMKHVTDLDVSGNELEGLDGVQCLRGLKRLNAASNRIHTLGDHLRPLDGLEWLNVSFNLLEDVLGLREMTGAALRFVDISGNVIRRWEAVDALSHCSHLRELRITIARCSGTSPTAPPHHSPASTSLPALRDQVDEASLQLLDNPLVGTAGYQDHIRTLLPQLVLLDGRRVGFDPLQEPSSIGYPSNPSASSSPAVEASGGGRFAAFDASPTPPRPSALSVNALHAHQLRNAVEDMSPLMLRTTPPPGTSVSSGGVKTKHISRSSQTEAPSPMSMPTSKAQRSVAVEAALSSTHDDAHAQLVRELERRNSEHAAAAQRERSEHRSKVLKLQQLLSTVTAERDDARLAGRDLEASAAHELHQHLQSHAHTVAQVAALKEELQRSTSDAERHEQIALKLQRDRLISASKDHDEHKKQKWNLKLSALEREHRLALSTLEEVVTSRTMAAHSAVLEAKDRALEALRTEVGLLKERNVALDADRRSADHDLRHRLRCAVSDTEAAQRNVLEVSSLADQMSMRASLTSQLQLLRDAHFRREWDQLLRAYHNAVAKPKAPSTSEVSTSTMSVACHLICSEVQTEPLPPPAPCPRCPPLARRVVEMETISASLAQRHADDGLRITELESAVATMRARQEQELHDVRVDIQEQHQRTVNNLKASMAAQDDAHHQEIEDITADYRNKVEEKRTMISQLQDKADHYKAAMGELQQQLADREANAAAAHQQRAGADAGQVQQLTENAARIALENQQLRDAVNTLRHQLVAVDAVNRSLSIRTEEAVAQLRASEHAATRLQQEVRAMVDAKATAEGERNRIREQLRSIAA